MELQSLRDSGFAVSHACAVMRWHTLIPNVTTVYMCDVHTLDTDLFVGIQYHRTRHDFV